MKLKFVCLNLWQGGNLFDGILDFLAKEDADVLALQEVYNGTDPALAPNYRSLEVLQDRFHFPALDFAPAFLDNRAEGQIAQGNAILSKFPITAHDAVFFADPYRDDYTEVPANFPTTPRNLEHAVLETPAGPVHIYNLQGVWDLDGGHYSDRRRRMGEAMVKAARDKTKVIMAGDTNTTPDNQAIEAVEKELKSVFAGELKTSFNMRQKTNPGYATAVVDMIFVSPDIKVLDHRCPDVDISDHLPLVATLEL